MVNIAEPFPFKNYLEYGPHRIPLDTARSFQINVRTQQQQPYLEVTIFVDTLDRFPNGERIGWGRFKIKTDSLEKVVKVIQRLVECNVHWQVRADTATASLKDETIDLFYDSGARWGLRDPSSLNWGEQMVIFKKVLGFESSDYTLEQVWPPESVIETATHCFGCFATSKPTLRIGRERIRIRFMDSPDVQQKMVALIKKLDQLSDDDDIRIKDLFKGSNELPFEFDNSSRPVNPAYNFTVRKPPYSNPRPNRPEKIADSANFEYLITDTEIKAHSIWSHPGPWQAEDVPYLIATSERKPT